MCSHCYLLSYPTLPLNLPRPLPLLFALHRKMLLCAHNTTDELTHDSFDGVSCNGVLCVQTDIPTLLYPSTLQNMNLDIVCISVNLLDTQSEKITHFNYLNILYSVQDSHMWTAELLGQYTPGLPVLQKQHGRFQWF
jgi:hypothetical protein